VSCLWAEVLINANKRGDERIDLLGSNKIKKVKIEWKKKNVKIHNVQIQNSFYADLCKNGSWCPVA
jgi:hypothetical protein